MSLNRRRKILINRKFQYRYIFYTVSWILALSSFYPLVIMSQFNHILGYLQLDPLGPTFQEISQTKNEVFYLLIFFQVFFVVAVVFISLFLSHRIAGPIRKLENTFARVKNGEFITNLTFRKADHFPEIAVAFNEMMKSLAERGPTQSQAIESVVEKLKKVEVESSAGKRALQQCIEELEHTRPKT